jgi:hypothetical protein
LPIDGKALFSFKENGLKLLESKHVKMIIYLLQDTLVFTQDKISELGKRKLLYPPMPLTHIPITKNISGNGYRI